MATSAGVCQIYKRQRPTLSTRYGTVSWVDQLVTWWQVDHIGSFLLWKGQSFILLGVDTYSAYGFDFHAHISSAKPTIHGYTECPIHHNGIPYSIASDQSTHFTAEK